MLITYFRIACRNLLKHKGYSFIYIVGLAVGIGLILLDGLWIHDELSFNNYHKNHDRIAQIIHHVTFNSERMTLPYNPWLLGDALRKEYGSDFKRIVMSTYPGDHVLSYEKKNISRPGSYMDAEAPAMFSLEMEAGVLEGLMDPHSILLSESTAKAFFGKEDAMGKTLMLDNSASVKVTGVYKDIPFNSDFTDQGFIAPWRLFLSISGADKDPQPWNNNNYLTYVQLADGANMEQVSSRIKDLKRNKMPPAMSAEEKSTVFLHPMNRWHLYSEFKDGVPTGGRIVFVRLFAIIGLFVLLQACINFINLSTARAQNRAKEIGIRKTIGGRRGQLIQQFFVESVMIALLAFVFALILVRLFLPFFNQIADKKIAGFWSSPWFWSIGALFSIAVGLMAGIYPAIYLSSFDPVKVLKGIFKAGPLTIFQRKALVVLQFTISVVLIIGTIVVFRQIEHAKDRPIGYDPKGVITIGTTKDIYLHYNSFFDDLKRSGAVADVAYSVNSTTVTNAITGGFKWAGMDPNASPLIAISNISSGYGKLIGWTLKEGRDFSARLATDSSGFILNEAAVKLMGLKNPIGSPISFNDKPYHVIGVIRDMIIESPFQTVGPYIYTMAGNYSAFVTIKLDPSMGVQTALAKVGAIYTKYNPSLPFTYQFTDLEYAKKFADEIRVGKLAALFAVLAVFISCLGIFGLSTFAVQQRMKEISIRKVLGASVLTLYQMLSSEFLVLVAISLVIAVPIAWFGMSKWLQQYEYRTTLAWWIFAAAGLGALVVTILTVGYQSIKAATANPTGILRSE
ncbi:MAG TPA: ABC transporter permease [Puia sp.]|jgi:ABC-type antimicrobial peptide transport system permease subunit|nr:ABC transporter permease [Puia sp.]